MDIKKVLTEAEIGSLGEDAVLKLENAFRTELAQAVKTEAEKNATKFNALVESVNHKVEGKIAKAISENVEKMKSDAINSKMFDTLKEMANLLEGVGIPCTELSKRLTEQMAEANRKLQEDYKARELLKKELNQDYKMRLVDALTAGCHPDVIQAARAYFKDKDVREINKDSVAQVISGDIEPSYPHDVDPDVGSDLNMDKIDAALNEINDSLDLDVPGYKNYASETKKSAPSPKTGRFESLGKGLRAEKVRVPKGMMEAAGSDMDDEVSDVMRQMAAFGELGLGGKFV